MPACRVLVLHDQCAEYIDELRGRFSEINFSTCIQSADVNAAIACSHPQVVFSFRSAAMPGPEHRQAVFGPDVRWIHVGGASFDHLYRSPAMMWR